MGQLTPAEQARQRASGIPQPVGRGQAPVPNAPVNTPRNQPPPAPAFGGPVMGSPNTPVQNGVSAIGNAASNIAGSGAPNAPVTSAFSGVGNSAQSIAGAFTPSAPAPGPTPISFNGGSYNPTTAPYGYDLTAPGTREQFWNQNQGLWFQSPQMDWVDAQQGQYTDPWQGEQWNQQNLSSMNQPGAGQQFWNGVQGQFNSMAPTNAQTAFDMTKGMLPGSLQPQFDSYYDRMKEKVMGDVNSQSAARGAYGSNTALNNSIGAGLDVEANRAKAGTDFSLADSANQREWQNTLGTQGRNADLSKTDKLGLGGELAFDAEKADLDRDKFVSDAAFGIDEHRRNRLESGTAAAAISHGAHAKMLNDAFEASGETQEAFEGRVNNLYNQVSGLSKDVQGFVMENMDSLIAGDETAFWASIDASLGKAADERNWSDTQEAQAKQDIQDMVDTYLAATGKKKKK